MYEQLGEIVEQHPIPSSRYARATVARKISNERYESIQPMVEGFFQHFPGVYCQGCGNDFALYSYSASQPHGVDENNKPFYKTCGLCP